MDKLTAEFKEHLQGLNRVDTKKLLVEFRTKKVYSDREPYLNREISEDILTLWEDEVFIGLEYLEPQAKYMLNYLKLDNNKDILDMIKTFVYTYNTNQRVFNEAVSLKKLEADLFSRGFKKVEQAIAELKQYDKLKVSCVLDVSCIGLLGSFDKKMEQEGTLIYSESQKSLMLLPKCSRTRGFIIRKDFYYKERERKSGRIRKKLIEPYLPTRKYWTCSKCHNRYRVYNDYHQKAGLMNCLHPEQNICIKCVNRGRV